MISKYVWGMLNRLFKSNMSYNILGTFELHREWLDLIMISLRRLVKQADQD